MAQINPDKSLGSISSLTILFSDLIAGYDSFYTPPFSLYKENNELNLTPYLPIIGMMPLHEDNREELPRLIKDLIKIARVKMRD